MNDWIPASVGLARKREVLAIARATGRDRHQVTGLLVDFWGWASDETDDGFLKDMTLADLVESVGGDQKFWEEVAASGWLAIEQGDGLRIPEADEWITRGAKARLKNARRQAEFRDKSKSVTFVTPMSQKRNARSATKALLQDKTREENKIGEAKPRKRNLIWDSLCESFGLNPVTENEQTLVGKLVATLKLKNAEPSDIPLRINRYKSMFKDMPCTHTALVKHWDLLTPEGGSGSDPLLAPARLAVLERDRMEAELDKVVA